MRLNSRVLLISVLQVFLCNSLVVQAAPSATASATVTLDITVTEPPCNITFPSSIVLGTIPQGVHSYPSFDINISCTAGSTTSTALFAQLVQGTLTSDHNDRIDMTSPEGSSGTPAQLWLTAKDGKAVVMDGSGSTNVNSQFCTGTTDRQCTLTPNTQVAMDTPRGKASAVVRFSVAYP